MNSTVISYFTRLPSADGSAKPLASVIRATAGLLAAALLLILGSTPALAQAPVPERDVVGTWTGALGSGAAKPNLTLTITKVTSGESSGELNSVDHDQERGRAQGGK